MSAPPPNTVRLQAALKLHTERPEVAAFLDRRILELYHQTLKGLPRNDVENCSHPRTHVSPVTVLP